MLNIHAKMFFLAAGIRDLSAQSRPGYGHSQPSVQDAPAEEHARFVAPRNATRVSG